ncbi:MAG: NAD-dependent deacetylase [Kiritimatiellae bacterium]|nr:NAD-dependent deacetylase [Kiritimatiellia bacterium]
MDFRPLLDAIASARRPVFFTGAGVSTLCGIPDFRGPNGVYRDPDAARMFEIALFDEDPSFFYRKADSLVYGNDGTKPGPVHEALAALQRSGLCAGVVTQNIDGLHERAGSSPVFAVHGSAATHHCRTCGDMKTFEEIRAIRGGVPGAVPRCKICGGVYKPDITFFGEALPEAAFDGAVRLASSADLVVVLGSSLTVQPAASIPPLALRAGGRLAIVNRGETPLDRLAFFRADDLAAFARAALAFAAARG